MECWESGWALEQASQGSVHGTRLSGVKETFEQHPQMYGLIFAWFCVELGAGLNDSGGSQLRVFYNSMILRFEVDGDLEFCCREEIFTWLILGMANMSISESTTILITPGGKKGSGKDFMFQCTIPHITDCHTLQECIHDE